MFEGGGSSLRKKANTEAELIDDIPLRAWLPKKIEHVRPGFDAVETLL